MGPAGSNPLLALSDLSLQLSSLRASGNCPEGTYVTQDDADAFLLHGVLFPPFSGPFAGAVFPFEVRWLGGRQGCEGKLQAPRVRPEVVFRSALNHPLIHPSTKLLSLAPRFSSWVPRRDTLSHLLFYVRECFGVSFLEEIKAREGWWTNTEMGRLLRSDTALFKRLSEQSVTLSLSKAALSSTHSRSAEGEMAKSNGPCTSDIVFSELGRGEMDTLRREIFGDT